MGPLVVQAVIPVESQDTPERLARRVHEEEHRIYPLAMRWFAEGRLRLGEQGALLDGQALPRHRPSDSHQGDSQCVKPCCSC